MIESLDDIAKAVVKFHNDLTAGDVGEVVAIELTCALGKTLFAGTLAVPLVAPDPPPDIAAAAAAKRQQRAAELAALT